MNILNYTLLNYKFYDKNNPFKLKKKTIFILLCRKYIGTDCTR